MARAVRAQQSQLRALIDALYTIRRELQYRLTPLPEVFAALSDGANVQIAALFASFSAQLRGAQTCTVGYAYRQALRKVRGLQISGQTHAALLVLFDSLGKYDLEGNLQLLSLTAEQLQAELRQTQAAAGARCKTYITLGVCTGLAAAVILL